MLTRVVITCDGCRSRTFDFPGPVAEAREPLRRAGWKQQAGRHTCPGCAGRKERREARRRGRALPPSLRGLTRDELRQRVRLAAEGGSVG